MLIFHSFEEIFNNLFKKRFSEFIDNTGEEIEKIMVSSTCCEDAVDVIFIHESLGIPFKNIHLIVNPFIFDKHLKHKLKEYDEGYSGVTQNIHWGSIIQYIKRSKNPEIYPIAIISLDTIEESFGECSLSEIMEKINLIESNHYLLLLISRIGDEEVIMKDIEKTKNIIEQNIDINRNDKFKINRERGDSFGLCTLI